MFNRQRLDQQLEQLTFKNEQGDKVENDLFDLVAPETSSCFVRAVQVKH